MSRPSVTVVVPFAGSAEALERLLEELGRLELGAGDEVIVADNSPDPHEPLRSPLQIRRASEIRTPAYARNQGARDAQGDWLVFLDADTRPAPDLLDRYFDPPPQARTAVLAGSVRDTAIRPTLAARHSVQRNHLSQRTTLDRGPYAYAQTANCAVRRESFEAVGGFDEHARAGEDADLCFRLAQLGWGLEERPGATAEHRSRETLRDLAAQLARHGAGAAWLNKRYPGSFPPPRVSQLLRGLSRSGSEAIVAAARGRRERAAFALIDAAATLAFELGRLLPNRR